MSAPLTRHVVLVTYGEPTAPTFTEQLVYSWRILVGLTRTVAPIPLPLLPLIALARARNRTKLWGRHAYGSPLEPLTVGQAGALTPALTAAAPSEQWKVHVAYEFRRPLLEEVLQALPAADPVYVVPLSAADSSFTHALSRGTAASVARRPARRHPVTVLGALDADVLADLSARHVLDQLGGEPQWRGEDVVLVLAAHGTVTNPSRPIDTGLAATDALREAIAARLSPHFGSVAHGWLNHTRGGRWTEPAIEHTMKDVVARGYSRVVYYPYGFLADNAESELEGRLALDGHPFESRYVACLNDSPYLMDALVRQILDQVLVSHQSGGRSAGAPASISIPA
jgi:protoheme ferro-lyase